ncbi:uncharacterized protein LOC110253516 [Exaiptasia diaphana]|uniref:Uncharacterized protein n=1 Tax=Exaiptasia diaphana TaxID=2652724 RepID=A0A913Y7M7_EXADI|nr:uncharacterized protein LOC110253516 [Exaiptasia diaphana]KXJ28755.1 hypothetical protein AC249_AIPGENE3980 [Exaiptasia diaphana]
MGCFGSRHERNDVNLDEGSYEPLLDEEDEARSTATTRNTSRNETKNVNSLETLLMKLNHSLNWRNVYVDLDDKPSIAELRTKLHELLNSASVEMGFLIQNKRYFEAEDVVDAILKVKSSLGNDLFEAVKIPAFVREVSTFDNFVLTGGQYFEPMMVNEDDDNLLKVFFFLISDPQTRQTMFRYYVEYSSLIDEFFALRLVTSTEQLRVEMYGSSCPSYWDLRQDVIRNARKQLEEFEEDFR